MRYRDINIIWRSYNIGGPFSINDESNDHCSEVLKEGAFGGLVQFFQLKQHALFQKFLVPNKVNNCLLVRAVLNQDIRVKGISLDIDGGKCLPVRIKFPHNNKYKQ